MDRKPRVAEFLDGVYASVDDPEGWPYALETLAELFRSTTTGFAYGHQGGGGAISLFVRSDAEWERQYAEYYAFRNPFSRGECLIKEGATIPSELMCPDAELQKTEYYADFLRPRDLRHVLGSFLSLRTSTASHVVVMRPGRRGPFEEREVLTMERLVPHLQLALKVHRHFSELRAEIGAMREIREGRSVAVFGVDRTGRILWSNASADVVLSGADGLSRVRGVLTAATAVDALALRTAVAAACDRDEGAVAGGEVLVSRPSGRLPYRVLVSPCVSSQLGGAKALVLVALPIDVSRESQSLLQHVLCLTAQQAKVVSLLAQGHEMPAVARKLRIEPSTLRVHLRSIYRTTGIHSKAELVCAALQVLGVSR